MSYIYINIFGKKYYRYSPRKKIGEKMKSIRKEQKRFEEEWLEQYNEYCWKRRMEEREIEMALQQEMEKQRLEKQKMEKTPKRERRQKELYDRKKKRYDLEMKENTNLCPDVIDIISEYALYREPEQY